MTDNWHRIEKVVKWTGLSVHAFARAIGLKRSENLYQIKRGNNGISRELADIICAKYPTISKGWMLSGEGEMFIDSPGSNATIPFYRMDAVELVSSGREFDPAMNLNIPFLENCDFAALCMGKAMEPEIPAGAVIVCAQVDADNILPGESYLIVGDRFTGVRTIRKEVYSTQLRLVPKNSADFDQMLIDKSDIKELYQIKGVIINKSI